VTTAIKAHQLKIKSASDHNRVARRFGHGARREPRCWHQQRQRAPHIGTIILSLLIRDAFHRRGESVRVELGSVLRCSITRKRFFNSYVDAGMARLPRRASRE
jgi:hypothetical protein